MSNLFLTSPLDYTWPPVGKNPGTAQPVGMGSSKQTFQHCVELPNSRCFETLLRGSKHPDHVTMTQWHFGTPVSAAGVPATSRCRQVQEFPVFINSFFGLGLVITELMLSILLFQIITLACVKENNILSLIIAVDSED